MYFMYFSAFSFQTINQHNSHHHHPPFPISHFPFLAPKPKRIRRVTGSSKGIHQLWSPAIQELWKNLKGKIHLFGNTCEWRLKGFGEANLNVEHWNKIGGLGMEGLRKVCCNSVINAENKPVIMICHDLWWSIDNVDDVDDATCCLYKGPLLAFA